MYMESKPSSQSNQNPPFKELPWKWLIPLGIIALLAIAGITYAVKKNSPSKTQSYDTPTPTASTSASLTATTSPSSTSTATATPDEATTLKTVIKNAIAAKSGGDASGLTITVSKIEGLYAKGSASDETSGAMWFAAKVNGTWKLVWDGNGAISCSDLTDYPNFPVSMIPDCYDDATQTSKTR